MLGKRTVFRDVIAGAMVMVALALPVFSLFGDNSAVMKVRFRTGEMEHSRSFTAQTSHNVCAVLSAALSYEDPNTGEYTQVACAE